MALDWLGPVAWPKLFRTALPSPVVSEFNCADRDGPGRRRKTMDLTFTVAARIAKPVAEVFEAIVNPAQLSRYFTTGGAKGRLETGATVSWDFHDFPGAFPVWVVEVEPERRIVLRWEANDGAPSDGDAAVTASAGYKTTVTMTFEPREDGWTLVSIAEEGWRETEAGLKASYGNCQGWKHMLCALKALSVASDKMVGIGVGLRWPSVMRPGVSLGWARRLSSRPRSRSATLARPCPRSACNGAAAAIRRWPPTARHRSVVR